MGLTLLGLTLTSRVNPTINGTISAATLNRFRPLFSVHLRQLSRVKGLNRDLDRACLAVAPHAPNLRDSRVVSRVNPSTHAQGTDPRMALRAV